MVVRKNSTKSFLQIKKFHTQASVALSKILNRVPNCHDASLNSSETLNFNLKEMNPKMCTVWLKPGSKSLSCTKTTISRRNGLQIQKNPENGIKKLQEKVRNKFNFFFFSINIFSFNKKKAIRKFSRGFGSPILFVFPPGFFFFVFFRVFFEFSLIFLLLKNIDFSMPLLHSSTTISKEVLKYKKNGILLIKN